MLRSVGGENLKEREQNLRTGYGIILK